MPKKRQYCENCGQPAKHLYPITEQEWISSLRGWETYVIGYWCWDCTVAEDSKPLPVSRPQTYDVNTSLPLSDLF